MIGRVTNRLVGATGGITFLLAGLVAIATAQPAYADDGWGCQVVLCLATPGSPTTYAACVPPITKLWQHLALGRGFPTCTGVGIRTKSTKHGYNLSVTRSDGTVSRYALDTRYQTVTQQ